MKIIVNLNLHDNNYFYVTYYVLDQHESVSVMVTVDKNDYLLCNLSKHKNQQQYLDLNFQTGDTIAFMTKGKGIVHLTGTI